MIGPSDMPRADELGEPDFITTAAGSHCQHCGVEKEATAKFFIEHYRECVEPRRLKRIGGSDVEGR